MSAIENAEQATSKAMTFLKRHRVSSFARPIKATKSNGTWVVELDFGITMLKVGKIILDAQSGVIREYDLPR